MDPIENQWQRLAQRTGVRLRLGAVCQASIPGVVLLGVVLLGLGITVRLNGWKWTWTLPAIVMSAVVMGLGSVLLMILRSRASAAQVGLARLDSTLGLNNALSAAAAGRGKWPELPANSDDLLRFKWGRVLSPYVICVLLAVSGLLIPLPAEALGTEKIPPPRSHENIAALIAELQNVEALKQEDLLQLQQQLDEIRNQPADDWYRHSSLEAADHLQTGLLEQLRALESGLNKAASSLAALEEADETLSNAEKQRLASEFKAALQGLKNSSPGLNQKLMEALAGIDPANLKSLTKDDLGQMLKEMKAAADACRNCQGPGQGGRSGGNREAQSELDKLLGPEGSRQGQQEGTGRGGIQRGPGVAALPLSRNPTELATDKPESIETKDLSRTRPGDALGTADTEHKFDQSPVGPQAGGSAATGHGGDAVSRDALVPSEKAILKAYFR